MGLMHFFSYDGCATALRFRQITDVARSLGDPIRFTPDDSIDRSTGLLSEDAQRRIHLLVLRVRHISLGGIEIQEMPGKRPSVTVKQDLALLRRLISEALQRDRVTAASGATDDGVGECSMRQQPEQPAVCVDVWR